MGAKTFDHTTSIVHSGATFGWPVTFATWIKEHQQTTLLVTWPTILWEVPENTCSIEAATARHLALWLTTAMLAPLASCRQILEWNPGVIVTQHAFRKGWMLILQQEWTKRDITCHSYSTNWSCFLKCSYCSLFWLLTPQKFINHPDMCNDIRI